MLPWYMVLPIVKELIAHRTCGHIIITGFCHYYVLLLQKCWSSFKIKIELFPGQLRNFSSLTGTLGHYKNMLVFLGFEAIN